MLRKSVTTLCLVAALTLPAANALALVRSTRELTGPKKVVINEVVDGPVIKCHRWGFMEVQLGIQKTELVSGSSKTVQSIKITSVSWPIFPNHTPRSIYINQQALPLLQQETLQLQANAGKELENIAGASNTTVSWLASLQAALVKAETP